METQSNSKKHVTVSVDENPEEDTYTHYKKPENLSKIVKIQSLVRMRYWYIVYMFNIIKLIKCIYERKQKPYIHESTVFGDNSKENIETLRVSFEQRQKQMKEGELAQILIGNWVDWEDLGIGHPSGLDCRKKDNSIIFEVKNKYNTCNSGSQKALLDKLSNYKRDNPNTRCIWAIVNPKQGCKKLSEKIIHNGVEIEKIQGVDLFKLVFTYKSIDYSTRIINIVKDNIHGN
jgi:hypothetical protein